MPPPGTFRFALRALSATALYLCFAAKLSWPECAIALASGLLAAADWLLLRRFDGRQPLAIMPPALWSIRLPLKVVCDGFRVVTSLVKATISQRRLSGNLRAVPFHTGGNEPGSAARRAWVTVGNSLSPNSMVIAIDRPYQRLLLHELAKKSHADAQSREWPL